MRPSRTHLEGVKFPAEVILLPEMSDIHLASWCGPSIWCPYSYPPYWPELHGGTWHTNSTATRHQGGANFGFADGHAKWMSREQTVSGALEWYNAGMPSVHRGHPAGTFVYHHASHANERLNMWPPSNPGLLTPNMLSGARMWGR